MSFTTTAATTIRSVSPWQKPDCLFCEADATREAVVVHHGDKPHTALIRFCGAEECLANAVHLASASGGEPCSH